MYQRSHGVSLHHFLKISGGVHVKDKDGDVVLAAHGKGSEVHDLKSLIISLFKGNVSIFHGRRVFFRVGRIHAINPCTFQDHFRIDLHTTQGGSGIRREKGVPGSEGEDQAIAFPE